MGNLANSGDRAAAGTAEFAVYSVAASRAICAQKNNSTAKQVREEVAFIWYGERQILSGFLF